MIKSSVSIIVNGILWNTSNPDTQITSSFDPMSVDYNSVYNILSYGYEYDRNC